MKEIKIESYGKINLGLDVLYKREDNYHEINTIMQEIDLSDILTIKDMKKGIKLESNYKNLPLDSTNIVYKSWEILKKKTGIDRGIHININKRIPVAAGLAGGSTNAAAALKALNDLWELNLNEEELREIGVEIGADVPFCIMGGTALAKGIGEKLTKLKSFKDHQLLLVNPGIEVSTVEVYKGLRLKGKKTLDTDRIISSIEDNDIKDLSDNMINVMEEVVIGKNPIIREIKDDLVRFGSLTPLMSGSGPTVFGFFEHKDILDYCKKKMEEKYTNAIVIATKTI